MKKDNMSKKAEQAAVDAYPEFWIIHSGDKETDLNAGARKVFAKGYEQGERVTIQEASNWIRDNGRGYVNGEYNEFHHCFEYDGTVDVERMVSDFIDAMENK